MEELESNFVPRKSKKSAAIFGENQAGSIVTLNGPPWREFLTKGIEQHQIISWLRDCEIDALSRVITAPNSFIAHYVNILLLGQIMTIWSDVIIRTAKPEIRSRKIHSSGSVHLIVDGHNITANGLPSEWSQD